MREESEGVMEIEISDDDGEEKWVRAESAQVIEDLKLVV